MVTDKVKVQFRLIQTDGYPPVRAESLWAAPTPEPECFRLLNIPFFARGVAFGDVVSARANEGTWEFQAVLERSGNWTIRLLIDDPEDRVAILDYLGSTYGCLSETSHIETLTAVSVPAATPYEEVRKYLLQLSEEETLGFEEGNWPPEAHD